MRLTLLSAATALGALCAASTPASAAQSISGQLNIVANSGALVGPVITDSDSQSFNGAPTTLNVSASATATAFVLDRRDTVTTSGAAQATWASANAGAVNFSQYGWDFNVYDIPSPDEGVGSDMYRNIGGPDWSYTFLATANGLFTMNYTVTGFGDDPNELQGWNIDFSGPGGGSLITPYHQLDPTYSDTWTAPLVAGQVYTVSLVNIINIDYGGPGGPVDVSDHLDGAFDWNISEGGGVPEPATWALVLLGFGGLGATLRRRRARSADLPKAASLV